MEKAGSFKDFFWILFTLAATATSALTYLQVRKSVRQPLYNKVLEEQQRVYEKLLEIMSDSSGSFLLKSDFQNMIRYNLISHLADKGFLLELELVEDIWICYMNQISTGNFCDPDLKEKLEKFEKITITIHEDVGQENEVDPDEDAGIPKNRKPWGKHEKGGNAIPGIYQLMDIRGAIMQTPDFLKIYQELQECRNSIYLPRRLQTKLERFCGEFDEVVLEKMVAIVRGEEDKILNGKAGVVVELDFNRLFNQLMETVSIDKNYIEVKKEIRKLLRIDERW